MAEGRQVDFSGLEPGRRPVDFSSVEAPARQVDFSSVEKPEDKKTVYPEIGARELVPGGYLSAQARVSGDEAAPGTAEEEAGYPEIIGKGLTREALTTLPKAAIAAEKLKERTVEKTVETFRPFLPRRSGQSQEERLRAIAEMKGETYVPYPEKEVTVERPPEPSLAERFVEKVEPALTPKIRPESRFKHIVHGAAGSAGRMLATIPVGGLPLMAATAGLQKGGEALEEGAPISTALLVTLESGGTEYVTELGSVGTLLKPGINFLRRLGKGLLYDIPGELTATAVEMAIIDRQLGKTYTVEQYKRALEDTAIAAGLLQTTATVAVQPFKGKPEITPEPTVPPVKAPPTKDVAPPEWKPIPIDKEAMKKLPIAKEEDFEPAPAWAEEEIKKEIEAKRDEIRRAAFKGVPAEKAVEELRKLEGELAPPEPIKKPAAIQKVKPPVAEPKVKPAEEVVKKPEPAPAPKKIPKGQSIIKMTESKRKSLKTVKAEVTEGAPPEASLVRDKEGYVIREKGLVVKPSEYPVYYQNKKYDRKEMLGEYKTYKDGERRWKKGILDKALDGEPLTELQREKVEDLLRGKRELTTEEHLKVRAKPTEVEAIELDVGDKFKRGGEEFEVKKVLDNGNIVVKDGTEMTLSPDDTVKIDRGTLQKKSGALAIKEKEAFPVGKLTDFERDEAGLPAVVSGTLPVTREGEKGAIDLTPAEEGKRSPAKELYNRFREFWKPLSTIPESEDFLDKRYETFGRLEKVSDIVEKVRDKTKKLDPESKFDVYLFLDGKLKKESLPENVRRVAHQTRNVLNMAGKMLVRRGLLDESVYEANKDKYIKYIYLKHVLDEKSLGSITAAGKLNLAYQKKRKGLTRDQQRALGLIEDVSVAAPIGLSQTLSDVVKYDFFNAISENPNWTFKPSTVKIFGKKMGIGALTEEVALAEKMHRQAPDVPQIKERLNILKNALDGVQRASQNVPDKFVQLPISKSMGPLSGAFVRREIARDIMPIFSRSHQKNISKLIDTIIDIETKGMTLFKVSKAALNVPTAFRNTISNIIQLNMSGIPLMDMPKYMVSAATSMKNKDAFYRQARRSGLFRTNWSAAEINDILDTVTTMEKKGTLFDNIVGLAKYYGKIDDFFKLAKFIEQRTKGKVSVTYDKEARSFTLSGLKGATGKENIENIKKSIREAQKWGMDYSLAHPAIKVARRHVIPFASYQYKVAPLIAETLKKRPWVIAKYMALPFILNEISKQRLKLTDDEWDKLEKELPLFIKKKNTYMALPWRSKEGEVQWFNYEYFIPWQGFMEVGRDIKEKQWNELPSDIGLGNPFLDIYAVLKTTKGDNPPRDPFTGREIYNQLNTPTEKAVKMSEWLYNRWAPTMLQRHGTLGKAMRIGEMDRQGRETNIAQTISSLFGVNIVAPTRKQSMIEKKMLVKKLRGSLVKIIVDPTIPKEEKARVRLEYQRRIRDIMGKKNDR